MGNVIAFPVKRRDAVGQQQFDDALRLSQQGNGRRNPTIAAAREAVRLRWPGRRPGKYDIAQQIIFARAAHRDGAGVAS